MGRRQPPCCGCLSGPSSGVSMIGPRVRNAGPIHVPLYRIGFFNHFEESTAEMRRRKRAGDPVELNMRLNRAIERLLKINRKKDKVQQPVARRVQFLFRGI